MPAAANSSLRLYLCLNRNTLLELIQVAPAGNTAFLLPEAGIRVTYDSLRKQVTAMADALASMGIGRGRPRGHGAAQRIAGDRQLPGRLHRGNGRAAESGLSRG